MKVLVYGFGPYGKFSHNVTTDIIQSINRKKIAKWMVFDVRFQQKPFLDALKQSPIDLVIGLGQHPRAKKIRIERRARNWQAEPASEGRQIERNGPDYRYVSLKVPRSEGTTVTYDAGCYVCNFSMYLMCRETERIKALFAFLHVPVKVEVEKVVRLVETIVDACDKSRPLGR